MSEEKKEMKIDLKDRMLSEDDLNQVAGGYATCVVSHLWQETVDSEGQLHKICSRCGARWW